MKLRLFVALAALVAIFFITIVFISRFSLSALGEPGRSETAAATKAKQFLIGRAARSISQPSGFKPDATSEGDKLYGAECATCHGIDGHKPTDTGRWMYPRAADLQSSTVQSYSNPELFWIVKNGIKLSGMPAFGAVETDEHIWDLVLYVRTLPQPKPEPKTEPTTEEP